MKVVKKGDKKEYEEGLKVARNGEASGGNAGLEDGQKDDVNRDPEGDGL